MTNIAGRSFLSYRRTHFREATLIIEAQRSLGISTWQDTTDLPETLTENELRQIIRSEEVSNAVLLLTPDVNDSPIIRDVEFPEILARVEQDKDFFIIPVLAGGLDYPAGGDLLKSRSSVQNLRDWNLKKVQNDPLTYVDACNIAERVLSRRIQKLNDTLPVGAPIRMAVYTRVPAPKVHSYHLVLDWSRYFVGREAVSGMWTSRMLPAINLVSEILREFASERPILASGQLCIAAAVSLGAAFLSVRRQKLAWEQYTAGSTQNWSLTTPLAESGFTASLTPQSARGTDLAVLVSVTSSTVGAWSRLDNNIFRAVIEVKKTGEYPHLIQSSEEVVHIAHLVSDSIRRARVNGTIRDIHLFIAGPVGLAVLIGQLLNSNGPVHLYEHVPSDGIGTYSLATTIHPSMGPSNS